jgi:hypothetical protein
MLRRSMVLMLALFAVPAHAEPYVNFICADGSRISLIFEKSGTGLVMVDGGALRLENRHAAVGLWYASRWGELRSSGATATFRMAGRTPTTCRVVGRAGRR